MVHGGKKWLVLMGLMLALAGLTSACETEAERQARLEREAYTKSLDIEKLKQGLETVNPDPYDPKTTGTQNIGRSKRH